MRFTKITISPQRLEKPDLAYTLMPRVEDTQKGNAAVKYLEASTNLPKRPDSDGDTIYNLQHCPLPELDEAKVKEIVQAYQYQLRMLRDGAYLERLDWEMQVREKGFAALLPSLSPLRQVANVLHLATRLDIKNHRWAEACDKLRTGYALAAHMGQGETLIESLVGDAIAANMSKAVEDWAGEPGAPNLYWPVTDLPNPFNDLRRPLAFERASIMFSFPELRQMRAGSYSAEAWIRLVARYRVTVAAMQGQADMESANTPPPLTLQAQAAGLGLALATYPHAKQFLMERGMTAEQVEKMGVPETLERYFIRSLDEAYDDQFKWLNLPLPEGAPHYMAEREPLSLNQGNLFARVFLPWLGQAKVVATRIDRQIAMLRIVENIRAFAADAKSPALPDSLDQLPLPVPLNPMTGKPFLYERHGDTATLIDPGYNGKPTEGYRYEITLRH